MSWYSKMLLQTATYWAPGTLATRDIHGNDTYVAPVQTACRWEDSHELIFVEEGEQTGTNVSSRSTIFVDIELQNKGYLYLGVSSALDPRIIAGALPILKFEKTPSVDQKVIVKIAYV